MMESYWPLRDIKVQRCISLKNASSTVCVIWVAVLADTTSSAAKNGTLLNQLFIIDLHDDKKPEKNIQVRSKQLFGLLLKTWPLPYPRIH